MEETHLMKEMEVMQSMRAMDRMHATEETLRATLPCYTKFTNEL